MSVPSAISSRSAISAYFSMPSAKCHVQYLPHLPILSSLELCATQPGPSQPPPLRLQSTDRILEFQKIKSTFRSFPWNSQTPWQALLPSKGKDNLVLAHMEPRRRELSWKCPNLHGFSKCWPRYAVGKWRHVRGRWGRIFGGVARCQVLVAACMVPWRWRHPRWVEGSSPHLHLSPILVVEDGFMSGRVPVVRQRQMSQEW